MVRIGRLQKVPLPRPLRGGNLEGGGVEVAGAPGAEGARVGMSPGPDGPFLAAGPLGGRVRPERGGRTVHAVSGRPEPPGNTREPGGRRPAS